MICTKEEALFCSFFLVGCGWSLESDWDLISSKSLKFKTYLKRRMSCRDISGPIVDLLQNMQVLIPLFVLFVVDMKSMNQGLVHYLILAGSMWME